MLIRPITYKTVDGVEVTDTFHFHLSKVELMRMEAENEGGIRGLIERISAEKNRAKVLEFFEEIVLRSYGERSEDGKSFNKSPEIREAFKNSLAYDALIEEFAFVDATALADFIKGTFPEGMLDYEAFSKEMDRLAAEAKGQAAAPSEVTPSV